MKSNSASFDFLIRMILIGDTGVGKTSLIMRFTEETFTPQHIATIGNKSVLICGRHRF